MNNHLTQHELQLLDQILDQLIPANPQKGIPSAGVFGVGEFIISKAEQDKDASNALSEILSNADSIGGKVNVAMVSQLEANCASSFSTLLTLTYMGYYSRPQIRSLVGVGSWPVHPGGYEVPVESDDLIEKLTAPVRERGRAYRDPKDRSGRTT